MRQQVEEQQQELLRKWSNNTEYKSTLSTPLTGWLGIIIKEVMHCCLSLESLIVLNRNGESVISKRGYISVYVNWIGACIKSSHTVSNILLLQTSIQHDIIYMLRPLTGYEAGRPVSKPVNPLRSQPQWAHYGGLVPVHRSRANNIPWAVALSINLNRLLVSAVMEDTQKCKFDFSRRTLRNCSAISRSTRASMRS